MSNASFWTKIEMQSFTSAGIKRCCSYKTKTCGFKIIGVGQIIIVRVFMLINSIDRQRLNGNRVFFMAKNNLLIVST